MVLFNNFFLGRMCGNNINNKAGIMKILDAWLFSEYLTKLSCMQMNLKIHKFKTGVNVSLLFVQQQ